MGEKEYLIKEYLTIGNTKERHRIDAADICYIRAKGNYSHIYLTDGTVIELVIQLGDIKEILPKSIPLSEKNFIPVGRSFIVNKKNLSYICATDKERKIEFFGKRTKDYLNGYKDGYSAGHMDGILNISKLMPPDPMVLKADPHTQLPKEDLQELMEGFKKNTILINEK